MYKIISFIFCLLGPTLFAQKYAWETLDTKDIQEIALRANTLAKQIIPNYSFHNKEEGYDNLFRLYIASEQYERSNKYLDFDFG